MKRSITIAFIGLIASGLMISVAEGSIFVYHDENTGKDYTWMYGFTPEQFDAYEQLEEVNSGITLVEALSMIAPDALATMPEEMREYFEETQFVSHPTRHSHGWGHDLINEVWYAPNGSVVDEDEVPEEHRLILSGEATQPASYHIVPGPTGEPGFTPEMQQHLVNIGLSPDLRRSDLFMTQTGSADEQSVTLEGTTPGGERMGWTFALQSDGRWIDTATGQEMTGDMRYVIQSMGMIPPDRPEETPIVTNLASFSGLLPASMPGVSVIPAMPPVIISPAYPISSSSVLTTVPVTSSVSNAAANTGQIQPVSPERGISGSTPLFTSVAPASAQVASSPHVVTLPDETGYLAPCQGITTSTAILKPIAKTASIPIPMS